MKKQELIIEEWMNRPELLARRNGIAKHFGVGVDQVIKLQCECREHFQVRTKERDICVAMFPVDELEWHLGHENIGMKVLIDNEYMIEETKEFSNYYTGEIE